MYKRDWFGASIQSPPPRTPTQSRCNTIVIVVAFIGRLSQSPRIWRISRARTPMPQRQLIVANKAFLLSFLLALLAAGCQNPNFKIIETDKSASPVRTSSRHSHPRAKIIIVRSALPSAIVNTSFGELSKLGGEDTGYALYSYAIITSRSDRSVAFFREILASTPASEEFTTNQKTHLNILYIPIKVDESYARRWRAIYLHSNIERLAKIYVDRFYDLSIAQETLRRICANATDDMQNVCQSDLSKGPFLLTYKEPVTALENIPPPYLFVDLQQVHEKAFSTFLTKFKEQVKRQNFSDAQRLHTFTLKLLSITLTAADWIAPVNKTVADIVHYVDKKDLDKK